MSNTTHSELWNKRLNKPLDALFLDPNNYRFIDNDNYVPVIETDIMKPSIQQRTKNFIAEKNNEGIDDILRSFKTNGFLDVDQIQVRKLDDTNYVVIEGNRRITALKVMKERYDLKHDIGLLDPEVFNNVPVVVTDAVDDSHYKILMGLKHISGNKKWPAINQATLLKSLKDSGKSDKDIIDALGISKIQLNRFLRALGLIEQYKASDYGDQFQTNMFNLFSEIVKLSKLMTWLGWDEFSKMAHNFENLNRLFSWISKDEQDSQNNTEEDGERDKIILDPIVTKGTDFRDLVKFIDDEQALEQMEQSRSITEAYLSSDRISSDKFENTLDIIDRQLTVAYDFSRYATNESRERLPEIRKKFDALLFTKGYTEVLQNNEIQRHILLSISNNNFQEIHIHQFKRLKDLKVKNLNRVNIFAGENNTGKSTLLEAIYLLAKLNDIHSFNELQRRRGKFSNRMSALWLEKTFNEEMDIVGLYYGRKIRVNIQKEQEEDDTFNKADYLSTVQIAASYDNESFSSRMQLFENQDPKSYFSKISNVCNIRFSSPFSANDIDETLLAHSKSVEEKSIDRIIGFMRLYIDAGIENIELTNDTLARFMVSHKNFAKPVDITQFGDGMQRIFNIALQFASCKNGVLLIDEIENAIHHSLFKEFTQLIFQLSDTFKVQVFITSHSKECVDAFFEDETKTSLVSAYRLTQKNGRVECLYEEGKRYSRMIENFGADLRG